MDAQIASAYEQHRIFVKRTLRRFGVTYSDADDAVQQVFLVVHRRFDEYLDVSLKRAWLFSVSKFVSRNYHRGIRRARAHGHELATAPAPAPAPDIDELLIRREATHELVKCLDRLEERVRLPFYLANFEGLTAREIATALNLNMNTVYTRLREARILLVRDVAGPG